MCFHVLEKIVHDKKVQSSAVLLIGWEISTPNISTLLLTQVNKLKRDLACMKQELQFKEQGFETLKE